MFSNPLVGRTILVVDDEPALRSLAAALLEDLGYTAALAESGRAAVQLLLQDPDAIDAVLLDMTMPGMKPEETFRLMREISPAIPVTILSGEAETVVRDRFASTTIAGYIQKPYTDLELEAALAQALAAPASVKPSGFQLVRLSDQELGHAKEEYLIARRLEGRKMPALLAALDFDALQAIGHNLKGSGGCFGLLELTEIGKELEQSAQAADLMACSRQVSALQKCLNHSPSED